MVDASDSELNWEFEEFGTERPLAEMGGIGRTQIVQSGAAALALARRARHTEPRSSGIEAEAARD